MTVMQKHSRLPRKYEQTTDLPEPCKLDQSKLPALRETNPQEILQRYLSDESTKDIAATYGVTRQALGQYLLKVAEDDWKEAQVARAIARKEKAEDDLETAADALSLARAREMLKAAQWDLERTCRRIYGQDVQVQVQVQPVLIINTAEHKDEKVVSNQ